MNILTLTLTIFFVDLIVLLIKIAIFDLKWYGHGGIFSK